MTDKDIIPKSVGNGERGGHKWRHKRETLRETQMGESQRGEFSIDQIEELSLYT